MKVGDLAVIVHPSYDFGDSQLITEAWTYGWPVLILKEGCIEHSDGKDEETVLIQLGKKTTWILKRDLEVVDEKESEDV